MHDREWTKVIKAIKRHASPSTIYKYYILFTFFLCSFSLSLCVSLSFFFGFCCCINSYISNYTISVCAFNVCATHTKITILFKTTENAFSYLCGTYTPFHRSIVLTLTNALSQCVCFTFRKKK